MSSPTIVTIVADHAKRDGSRPALTFLEDGERPSVTLTYADLMEQAHQVKERVSSVSSRLDRILLLHQPGVQFVIDLLGCLLAGTVAVPLCPPVGHRDVATAERVAALVGPAAVLSDLPEVAASLEHLVDEPAGHLGAPRECSGQLSSDLALLQFTSGSTGDPKGVMITHNHLLDNQKRMHRTFGQGQDITVVSWLPLYHDMGLIGCVLHALYLGGHVVMMSPWAFLSRTSRWPRAMSEFKATLSAAPSFAYELCARRVDKDDLSEIDLTSVEALVCGGEPVRQAALERFASKFSRTGLGPNVICPAYGLAEATLMVTGVRPGTGLKASLVINEGRSSSAVSCGDADDGVVVVTENGEPAAEGAIGEIWVCNASVGTGYWGQGGSTETFGAASSFDGRRYLRTGDLGYLLEGALYPVSRRKDVIIVRGQNFAPSDIEDTIQAADSRFRPGCVAVVQVADAVVAVAELNRQSPEDVGDLLTTLRQAVLRAHGIRVDDLLALGPLSIPKTSSGKVRRSACRSLYLRELRRMLPES